MIVHSIALDFFRNYVHLDARFSPEVNVIYGENAQGKTNLLEAVAYLSTASSHRARYDRELIQFGVDHAFVKAEVSARGRDFTLEARLGRGVRRQLYSNGVRLKSAGELSGVLNTVLFCPEDLYLIREGAATRRRFLDGCICQLRPKYAEALAEYRRLYEHKVRILRDWEEHPSLLDTLDEFNLRMAQTGALLIHYRAHFVKRLREVTPPIHLDFSGGREELGLAYETVSTVTDPEDSPRSILPQLLAHQESHRKAELESRYEITMENYCKCGSIEALTMVDMARRDILPAVEPYAAKVAGTAAAKKALVPDLAASYETELVRRLSGLTDCIAQRTENLEHLMAQLQTTEDVTASACRIRDEILPAMSALRAAADEAETITASDCWPYPTYGDLLFSVR